MAGEQVRVLRVRSEESGSDKVAAALNKVAAGATAADQAVQKYIDDAKTSVVPITDALAKSQDDFSKATLSTAKSIQSLQQRIDPVARALNDYEKAQKRVNLAIDSGQITAEKGATILAGYEARYVSASQNAKKFANDNVQAFALNRAGLQELQASGINAFQAIAAGMSVTQVAMMEGAQVVGAVIQGTEGGFKGLVNSVKSGAASIASFAIGLGPWGIAIAAVTAGIAGMAYEFRKDIPDMDKTLKDQEDILGKIEQRYDGIREKIQALPTASGAGLGIGLGKNARDLQTLLKEQSHSTSVDFTSYLGQALFGAFDLANAPTRSMFAPIQKAVDDFRQSLKTGEPDVLGFRRELAELYNSAGATDKMKKAIEVAWDYTKPLAELEDRLNADREALKNMGKAEDEYAAKKKHASSTYLSPTQRQSESDSLAIRQINARTVAQKALVAAQQVRLNNSGKAMSPDVDQMQQSAAAARVFAEATRQANDALRDANRSLGEAGLDGYAASLKQINDQLRQQIELNPENAATWEEVADAQKKALDIQTYKSLFQGQQDTLAQLQAEAGAIGDTDRRYSELMTTLKAKIDLEHQGISVTSAAGQAYIENARRLDDYTAAVNRQKSAWDSVHDAESTAIDDLTNGLTSGDWKSALKSVENDVLKFGTTMAVSNPLKNWLEGSNLPTLTDLFTGKLKSPSLSLPGLGSLGTATNPMYVIPTTGAGGLPGLGGLGANGQSGGVLGWLGDLFGFGGGAAGGNASTGNSVASQVWNFFAGKGLAPHQIAGILGNIGQESSFNPLAIGDHGNAGGLFQDNGPRFASLLSFLGGKGNLGNVQGQLENAWRELTGPESSVLKKLLGATDVRSATAAFAGFERPQGYNALDPAAMSGWDNRLSGAEAALAKFGSTTSQATQGLASFGGGLGKFGQSLANAPAASGGGGGLFGWIGSLFGGGGISSGVMSQIAAAPGGLYANGDAFLNGISGFSSSVVSSPTLFRFASGTGMMGEAGPEGILPLRRNNRGQLGVIAANENGGPNVIHFSPVYHIDARGADQAAVTRLQNALDQHVQNHGKIVAADIHGPQVRKTRPA